MIGGEGEENPIWMKNGQWVNYAKKFVIFIFFLRVSLLVNHNAIIFYLERITCASGASFLWKISSYRV